MATVMLCRPTLHNAFNDVVIDAITNAFHEVADDANVRAVVLASEGKSFCAGADVHWMRRMVDYSIDENIQDARKMAIMLRTIRDCPKPVIARVHGAAIGGGVGLVAACDLSAAVDAAIFCLSEVKLGIVPAVISPFVLEKIGMGQLRRYGLTAERFSAAEARRIGLIHETFSSAEELDAWIAKTCEVIGGNGPEAVAACKRTITEVGGLDWDHVATLTSRRIAERRVSSEGQDGLKAFLEKRKPAWVAEK